MPRNVYNPIIHTSGKIEARSLDYARDTTGSAANKGSGSSFLSGSKIISNGIETDNKKADATSQHEKIPESIVASSTAKLPVFNNTERSARNGIMTPNFVTLGVAPPPKGNRECEDGEFKKDAPCYQCLGGKWWHVNDLMESDDSRRGCIRWFVGKDKVCEWEYIPQFGCKGISCDGCVKCEFGIYNNQCDPLCEECDGRFCQPKCPYIDQICVNGECVKEVSDQCKESECSSADCMVCLERYYKGFIINTCESRCGSGERCNGKGLCIGKCNPPCQECERCEYRNGVYGCVSEGGRNGSKTKTCCNGKIVEYSTGCEYLDENCQKQNLCPEGYVCIKESCVKVCSDYRDCNDDNCESCDDSGNGYKICADGCAGQEVGKERGWFCNGDGTCSQLKCNGCQELRRKDCGDKPGNNIDCWECVDICEELSRPGIPLTCVSDGGPGLTFSCQYIVGSQPTVMIFEELP